MNNKGFSLPEALLAMFVLGIVTSLIFGTIAASDRLFHQATLRQGLQSDVLRFAGQLKHDCALSDFWRTEVCNRTNDGGLRRDGVALVGLSDWDDPTQFDPDTHLPLWNRYIVYYAPLEAPLRLYRQVVEPSGTTPLPLYTALPDNIQDQPAWNQDVVQSSVLSDSVRTLQASKILQNGSVEIKVHLRRAGLKRANTNTQVVESLETTITVRLQNTWPEI